MLERDGRMIPADGSSYALYRGAPFCKSFQLIGSGRGSPMQIQYVMTQPVAVCGVNDSLQQAAMLMWERDCGVVPIVDETGKVVAMLTDRDICMAAYTQGRPLSEIGVRVAMSKHLVVCHPENSIEQAEERMSAHQLRRLPVVDPDGMPVGLISLSDLARAAVQPPSRAHAGTNGVRLQSTARTLAMVCALRMREVAPKSA
jgi:CBS domain-containing protein